MCLQGGHSSNPAVSAGDDPAAAALNRFQSRINSVGATGGRGLQTATPTSRLPDHSGGDMMSGNPATGIPDYTGRMHGHTPTVDPQASGRLAAEYGPHSMSKFLL